MSPRDSDRHLTPSDFEAAIEATIQAAQANNVDVEGAMTIPDPSNDTLDWSVEITRVRR